MVPPLYAPSGGRAPGIGGPSVLYECQGNTNNPFRRSGSIALESQSIPRVPLVLATEGSYLMRQQRMVEHLSLPSLQHKGRLHTLRARKERDVRLREKQAKDARREARRQRRLRRSEVRRRRKQEEAMHRQAIEWHRNMAATRIQAGVRRWLGTLAARLRKQELLASAYLQSVFRGYSTRRRLRKVQSALARAKEKKVEKWRAVVTIIIVLMRWLRRSRDRRWQYLLNQVKRALQGLDQSDGVERKATGSGMNVKRRRARRQNRRRASTISAISTFNTSRHTKNVHRLSIIEPDEANSLQVEINHIASGRRTTLSVEHFVWARLGKGKLDEMDDEQRQDTYRTLLDYFLMMTGGVGMALFDEVPTLQQLYRRLADVPPKQSPGGKQTKTLHQILSERLRMHFVEAGKVIFRERALGMQMFFIRKGRVKLMRRAASRPERTQTHVGGSELRKVADIVRSTASVLPSSQLDETGTTNAPPARGTRKSSTDTRMLEELADNYLVLADLSRGNQFGELAVLQARGGRRHATAVAMEDCELFSIHADDFDAMRKQADTISSWLAIEDTISSWLQNADNYEHPLTPDLEVLRRVVKPTLVAHKTKTIVKSTLTPIDKFRNAVRATMVLARWKKLSGVKVRLNSPEQSLLFKLRTGAYIAALNPDAGRNQLQEDVAEVQKELEAKISAQKENNVALVKLNSRDLTASKGDQLLGGSDPLRRRTSNTPSRSDSEDGGSGSEWALPKLSVQQRARRRGGTSVPQHAAAEFRTALLADKAR